MAEEQANLTKSGDLAYDNEYSRLIGTLGKEALERLQKNKVLICGMKGLGLEVAKNLALMGVKQLTIHDPEAVQHRDMSSNFFLTEDDVGKNRAEAIKKRLHELNDRCDLKVYNGELTDGFLSTFRIIVQTNNKSLSEMKRISSFCHQNNIGYLASDAWGVTGYIFVDLGKSHKISDRTGERPKTGYIAAFNRHENNGMCVCIDRHDLEDGMVVRMSEVQGIESLNGKEFKVSTMGPLIFTIGDVSEHEGEYIKGGMFEEVKQPVEVTNMESLDDQLKKPIDIWSKVCFTDHSKMMETPSHLVATLALLKFRESHGGELPKTHDDADAAQVVEFAKAINAEVAHVEDQLDAKYIERFAHTSRGDLNPLATFFGGILAQEAIKASSGKYTPINQWLFYDGVEVLPEGPVDRADFVETGTRYDGQVAVFGNKFQEKLGNLTYFLVGAGAIGCEMLKNWAMIGIGAGENGQIYVTDNDIIEISNLNRQFLYRGWDVSHPKSETAAKAALVMNPQLKIKAYTTKVCPETEDVFDEKFWNQLDGVTNALDNIHARLYIDSKCTFFGKSLLESGTLGTKGNTQVVVPNLTQTYGETSDPEPKEVAKCLLHSFPSNIDHCLQWGRELLFEGEFVTNAEYVNDYAEQPDYIAQLTEQERRKKLNVLGSILLQRQKTLDDCVVWARDFFEEQYFRRPTQLIHTFPVDAKDNAGQPFWQGTRRPPTPTKFDAENPLHMEFIVATAFLRAYTLGILDSEFKPEDIEAKRAHFKEVAAAVVLPEFVPKANLKIKYDASQEDDEDAGGVTEEDEKMMAEVLSKLPTREQLGDWRMNVLDFEKDDDSNFHVDFVTAAANLRGVAYGIPTVSRLQAKLIAGKIIPAIVTTTACVAGLVCIEFYKLIQGKNKLSDYRNTFANLALPIFNLADPVGPMTYKFKGKEYTTWDSIKITEGDMPLQALIDNIQEQFSIEVEQILFPKGKGLVPIYVSYLPAYSENLNVKVSELIAQHTTLLPNQNCFKLVITPEDDDDDMMDMAEDDAPAGDEETFPPVWFYYKVAMDTE